MTIAVGQTVYWTTSTGSKKAKTHETTSHSGVVKSIYYALDDHWLPSSIWGAFDPEQAFLVLHEGPGLAPIVKTVADVSETAPE